MIAFIFKIIFIGIMVGHQPIFMIVHNSNMMDFAACVAAL